MKPAAFALAALLLPAPVLAAASPDDSITRINAAPAREGWFVCDAVSGPYALFAGKVTGGASVITLLDRRTGRFDTQSYQVGPADPGAGQIYWSLSRGGKEIGNVHAVNPGMIEDDGATVPTVTSVKLDDRQLDCRFLAHTRFIGIDSRRTVVVIETPQGLVYQAFGFQARGPVTNPDGVQRSNKPTLRLLGGSEIVGDGRGFRFANGGYVYFIQRPRGNEAAGLTITRNGRLLGAEKFVGFTYAPPLGRAPERITAGLGPDAVWSGQGIDACRKGDAKAVDGCLIDLMRKGGASAASIAFTQKLIAAENPGYVSGWKQVGPVGIASVAYPFRANTNAGTWLVPVAGDPIDVDAYQLTVDDKQRADYKAAMANSPDAFPVPPGDIAIGKTPAGNLRVLVTTPTATCHACAPGASIIVGFDFDAAGHFLFAGVVAVA
ncbi:MAG TPA: hypothetical protein VGC28_08195 [Sphingomonas sp.]